MHKKTTTLLSPEEIADIRASGVWPGASVDNILSSAQKWMKYSMQELRDKVPPASVPRAFDVHFKQDPQHPEEIKAYGKYPWIIDPDKPYKVTCPYGGEVYPTNDFDPNHPGSPADVSSEPYVDNGWGYRKPGEPQKYWFVAYYAHWLYYRFLQPAAMSLAQAYIITGDPSYARQTIALLDRIAEEYPKMDHGTQSRYGTEIQPGKYHGRILNSIWETSMVKGLAAAYDYVFPVIDNDAVMEHALGKSAAQIRQNIEQNLLEEAAHSIYTMDGRIRGNFGMHQSALAVVAIVLDNWNTDTYIDFVLNATGLGNWQYEGIVPGLANLVFRDGAPNESSPGYNSLWIHQFEQVAKLLLRRGINIYQQEPKLKALFAYPLRLVMADRYTPNIGDTGAVLSSGIVGWNQAAYMTAHQQYGESAFATGKALSQESDNMSAYGLAMLRSGQGNGATGVAIYYGPGGGHDHFDRLNLELFAKGLRISPDLGYPEYASAYCKHRYGFNGHTISHNTVLVDQKRQLTKNGGRLQTFTSSPHVQYVDVQAEEAYPAMVELYGRSVALINASDDDSYLLDVFRVHGGTQHDYSLHGPAGDVRAHDLNLRPLEGTLAGENIPFAYLYDAPEMEAPGYSGGYANYRGSGFSYLTNVQHGVPNGIWDADWHVGDSQIHLRVSFVPQPGQEVFIAEGQPAQNVTSNPKWLKYVIARNTQRQAGPLYSTFVTVWQPYTETPFIKEIACLPEPDTKVAAATGQVVALQVSHTKGTDYLFQSSKSQVYKNPDYSILFQGAFGLVSRDHTDRLRHAHLVGGGLLRQSSVCIEAAGSYRGQVLRVDYNSAKVLVKLTAAAPVLPVGTGLAHQRIVFANDNHSTEYRIRYVNALGEQIYEIDLEEKALMTGKAVVRHTDAKSISSRTPLPLNQYYIGQWLVNERSGQGDRIMSISDAGVSITLEHGDLGHASGDACSIYDFGSGDHFTVASMITVEAADNGGYTITSNVDGKIAFADGVAHTISPGTTSVSI